MKTTMKTTKKLFTMLTLMLLMSMSLGFVSVSAASTTPPSKVTGVKQIGAGTSSVEISWTPANGCEQGHYRVERSNDKINWTVADESIGCDASIRKLAAGQTLYVRVAAYPSYSWRGGNLGEYSDILEVVTAPDEVKDVVQSAATTSSVTITWTAQEGVASYNIYAEDKTTLVATSATNSVEISGLAADSKNVYYVASVKTASTGYSASSSLVYTGVTAKTVPSNISKDGFGIANYWSVFGQINFTYNVPQNADGVELAVYKLNSKKAVWTNSSSTYFNYNKNTAYKYRVRAYITIGGQKVYGAWSAYRYFDTMNMDVKRIGNSKSVRVSWKKVKGAVSYKISISKSENTGYKKVATVKKNVTSYKISKFNKKALKKNHTYYVRIEPNIKSGKKKCKGDASHVMSFKLY